MTKLDGSLVTRLLIVILMALFYYGCAPDSSSSDDGLDTSLCVAGNTCEGINGTWDYTGYVTGSCGNEYQYDVFNVTQSECSYTLTTDSGRSGSGTVDGNSVCLNSTSYPDDGGTTTVGKTILTHTTGTMIGTSSWIWSDSSDSCSGTTAVELTKY